MKSGEMPIKQVHLDLLFELFDNPRDLLEISRSINMPVTTVIFRVKKMISSGVANLTCHINYESINALKRADVFCSVYPKKTEEFEKRLKEFAFWDTKAKYASNENGSFVSLVYPRNKVDPYKVFKFMKKEGVLDGFEVFPVETTYPYHPDRKTRFWYDTKTRKLNPQWDSWIREILESSIASSQPSISEKYLDGTKLRILEKISGNPKKTFKQIGEELDFTPQLIRHFYHKYLKRVLKYEVDFLPMEKKMYFVSVLECADRNSMNKVINARGGNPLLRRVKQVKTPDNTLLLYFGFPPSDYEKVWNMQAELVKCDIVRKPLKSIYLAEPERNPSLFQQLINVYSS